MKKLAIAIDGPAGAGKSSVSKLLAKALGYTYLDTGAMYRAVTYEAMKKGLTDKGEIAHMAEGLNMEVAPGEGSMHVLIDGEDITACLRTPEVSARVSEIAAIGGVRTAMVTLQRKIACKGGIILDGRDIGTVVLPDADLKIFLTASVKKRAERRFEEFRSKYPDIMLDEVEKAHRDVLNLFYQVFDRGFMRDGEGREIDFRNTVILMTANLGSDHIMQLLEEKPDATDADLHELLYPLLRDHFQPALMARFQTVIYRPLGQEAMRAIVEMKLAQVVRRLRQHYGLETEINDSLYDALTAACLLPDTGARNIDSLLNQQILPVLSQQLLAQQAVHHKPARLRLGWDKEDGIVLEFDEK